MRAVSFVGVSGSGKTTLIERVIGALTRRGFEVGAVKHTHHAIENAAAPPANRKDSERFEAAGAGAVALVGPDRVQITRRAATEPRLADLLTAIPRVDLLIVESWRSERLPCVEVIGPDGARVDPRSRGARIAIVADPPPADAGRDPVFGRDEIERIAGFLAAWACS